MVALAALSWLNMDKPHLNVIYAQESNSSSDLRALT
jgi:hypothetical protein